MLISRIRFEIAHEFTEELGIPYAEIARQLGVSYSIREVVFRRHSQSLEDMVIYGNSISLLFSSVLKRIP
jgi:hypothetical protein